MRANTAGAFIVGVAVGVAGLSAALWHSGSLDVPSVLAGGKRPVATTVPPPVATANSSGPLPSSPPPEAPEPTLPPGNAPPHPLALPIAGLDVGKITDTFNDARTGHKHEALDIPSPNGTPVLAVDEGNVVKLFTSKEGGLTVYQFDDSNNWSYYYAHLDRYAPALKEGTLLRKGDVLGFVGSTGNASPKAPHLHFAVNKLGADKKWWEGTPIDPLPLLKQ